MTLRHQLMKKFLPQSLLGRSLIILITPLIIVQVILSYFFFERHTDSILSSLAKAIVVDVRAIAELNRHQLPFDQINKIAQGFEFQLHFEKGAQLSRQGVDKERWLYQFMTDALDQNLQIPYFLRIDRQNIYIDVAQPQGVLHITTPRKRLYSRTTPYVVIWTTISAALLLIISSLFMRNQLKPIIRLSKAAENFGKGIDKGPIPIEGATEVRQAGRAFNIMRQRINRQLNDRMEMLAGVSHDLRTPLTRMKLQLTLMEQSSEVKGLKEDVEEMHHMVQGFLDFARGEEQEEAVEVPLKKYIEGIVENLKHLKIDIHVKVPEHFYLYLKKLSFNRCLTNLLLNSDRYANDAWISATYERNWMILYVDDNGPGIALGEASKVFKPFYRIDDSRNVETGGVGLGLSIAKGVVTSHGGEISLEKSPYGGLRVVIKIPC